MPRYTERVQAISTLDEAERAIAENAATALYFSKPGCGVCSALRPKIESLVRTLPRVHALSIDVEAMPRAAGRFSIFTLPAFLMFVDGKETIREARYMSIDQLAERLQRLYRLRFDEPTTNGSEER